MQSQKTLVGFDLETFLIEPGNLTPEIVCGSFQIIGGEPQITLDPLQWLAQFLAYGYTIVGANIAFDFACAINERPDLAPLIFQAYDEGRVMDVQLVMALHFIANGWMTDGDLIDPRTGEKLRNPDGKITNRFSLATCVDLCLGRKDAKKNDEWRLRYGELHGKPLSAWPEVAKQYPLDDARNTLEVGLVQLAKCKNLSDVPAQCRAAFAEHLGACTGILTDQKAVDVLETSLKLKYELLFNDFKGVFIRADGTKDMSALKTAVTKAYNGTPPTTEKGAVSTSREVLEDSGDKTLEKFAEISKTEKLLKTYVPFVRQKVVNTRPNPLLASGRSSYEGLIQTLPRKGGVRECFVARPGFVWSSVDYAAIELSGLAQVCLWSVGQSALADAINSGVDPHSLFGAQLVGQDYQTFLKRVVAQEKEAVDRRQAAKAGNFGFPGMMGAPKFVLAKRREGLKICELMGIRPEGCCGTIKTDIWKGKKINQTCAHCIQAAESLRRTYLYEMWTEMPRYFDWVSATLRQNDNKIVQFVSQRERGGLTGPAAANSYFQGLCGDGAKRALWAVSREAGVDTTSPLYGSRVVYFTHDEIGLEIPEEKAHEAAMRQTEIMIREMKTVIPDVAVKAEPALMKRWYKEAKPVFNKEGKLIPWEPK